MSPREDDGQPFGPKYRERGEFPVGPGSINIRMTPAEFMALAAWMSRHVEKFKDRTAAPKPGP